LAVWSCPLIAINPNGAEDFPAVSRDVELTDKPTRGIKQFETPDQLSRVFAEAQQVIATVEGHFCLAGLSLGDGEGGHAIHGDLRDAEISDRHIVGVAKVIHSPVASTATARPEAIEKFGRAFVVSEDLPVARLGNASLGSHFGDCLGGLRTKLGRDQTESVTGREIGALGLGGGRDPEECGSQGGEKSVGLVHRGWSGISARGLYDPLPCDLSAFFLGQTDRSTPATDGAIARGKRIACAAVIWQTSDIRRSGNDRPRSANPRAILATAVLWAWSGLLSKGGAVDYLHEIKPVLAERCQSCHGALKQKGGLRLDTAARLLEGGADGAIVIAGKPDASRLLERLTTEDPHQRMPLEAAPLKPEQIDAIRAWILAGAPLPKEEKGEADPLGHWSFQRVERPAVPEVAGIGHPVDAFFAEKHRKKTLVPASEAERGLLLRRLYLDLVGLPPTAEQLRDPRPYETIVDELLASPHHGERWARHWMDVWRYTDWYGLGDQLRNSQKHLWHWRDWIVESLNDDTGYDRMITEMLAADELAPGDAKAIRATGFLARNYYLFNRTTWLDDTIEHTGKAFLGLTLNCAKCHDHKYDPIDQIDYYNLRALFEPHQVRLDPVPGEIDFEKDGIPRVFDDHPEAETLFQVRGEPSNPDKTIKITPAVPAVFASFAPAIEPVALPMGEWAPASRAYVRRDRLAAAEAKLALAREQHESALAEMKVAKNDRKERPAPVPNRSEAWLLDEFDGPNPAQWELIGESWSHVEGRLLQTRPSREGAMLRSRAHHPANFELSCRFTTTGGGTYRSVTFRFDRDDAGRNENLVYTSAHSSGPKVQVAHTSSGNTTYPAEGMAARPIEVGKTYELRFAVREKLVNVWLDNELVVAYELPRRFAPGKIALSGFDATVAFESVSIRALPDGCHLMDTATKGSVLALGSAVGGVELAKARLALAEAELSHLEAVLASDAAARTKVDEALARLAAQRESEMLRARAKLDLLTLGPKGDAKKIKAVQDALAAAEKKLASEDIAYTPLRAAKKAFETPEHKDDTYGPNYSSTSTGRRLMFAKWITSRENPLAARVAVNQVWMRHFGEPLVETVFDFGRQAPRPEHHELLDWLAAEFIDSGWSFKRLHRLLVTSAAYRRSSSNAAADPATLAADPGNRFYWRAHPRRMESQVVRDSLLHLAGELDPTVGGPPVPPNGSSKRRGLYLLHSRDAEDKFLTMFDNADILQCYRRTESIVPQQALALANAGISLDAAGKIAARIHAAHPSEDRGAFVDDAFMLLIGRSPDGAERSTCLDYWTEMSVLESVEASDDPAATIRARLVHAVLNHNDFVTVR
jgi:mono/diheme cytochrome c family protein